MNVEDIIANFKKRYRVLDCIDLGKLSKSELYGRVQSCKQQTFNNDQRVLALACRDLHRKFDDLPPDALIEFQKNIQQHDIPHHFIILITDIADIKKELEYLKEKYSTETKPIPFVLFPNLVYNQFNV